MRRERLIFTIYFVSALIIHDALSTSNSKEFCESETFSANCSQPDEVILIKKAEYGPVKLGRCITIDYGQTGCSVNVADYLNLKCAGRRKCEIKQPDPYLLKVNECKKEFKSVLLVSYDCIKVDRAACRTCSSSSKAELSNSSGYISSIVTYETRNDHSCGSSRCPWVIGVQPGQIVNVSILDYSNHPSLESSNTHHHVSRQRNSDTCSKSLIIKERANPRDVVVCNGGSGKVGRMHAYTSVSNLVEIQIVGSEVFANTSHFLVHYEAVGCPDIVPPKGSWIQRKVDKFEIGCTDPDTPLWELVCVGTEWKGVLGSCDSEGPIMGGVLGGIPKAASNFIGFVSTLPFGILLAAVIATAAILSVCILTVGYVCYKRSHHNQYKRRPQSVVGDQYMDINDPNCSLVQKVVAGKTLAGKGKGCNFSMGGENKYAANHHGRMMMVGGGHMPSGGATGGGVRPLPSIPDLRGTGAATVHRAGGMGGLVAQPPRMMIRSYGEGGAMGLKQRPDSSAYPQQVGGHRMLDQQHEYFVIEERSRADMNNDDTDSLPPPPDLLFPADSRQGSLMRPPNQPHLPPQQYNVNSSYRPPMTLSSALKQNINTYENQQAILGTLATAGITAAAAAGSLAVGKPVASEIEPSGISISPPLDI